MAYRIVFWDIFIYFILNLPGVEKIILLKSAESQNLYNELTLKKLCAQVADFPVADFNEVLVFEYKGKRVAIVDMSILSGEGKYRTSSRYLCLTTKNPDKFSGQTFAPLIKSKPVLKYLMIFC